MKIDWKVKKVSGISGKVLGNSERVSGKSGKSFSKSVENFRKKGQENLGKVTGKLGKCQERQEKPWKSQKKCQKNCQEKCWEIYTGKVAGTPGPPAEHPKKIENQIFLCLTVRLSGEALIIFLCLSGKLWKVSGTSGKVSGILRTFQESKEMPQESQKNWLESHEKCQESQKRIQ